MRKMATVNNGHTEVKRVILHQTQNGVYVFPCSSLEDGTSLGDYWYQTIAEADKACLQIYGINDKDWVDIGDPLEGCQQDWIAPVRVKRRNVENPQGDILERLEQDGIWREFLDNAHGFRTKSRSGKKVG